MLRRTMSTTVHEYRNETEPASKLCGSPVQVFGAQRPFLSNSISLQYPLNAFQRYLRSFHPWRAVDGHDGSADLPIDGARRGCLTSRWLCATHFVSVLPSLWRLAWPRWFS